MFEEFECEPNFVMCFILFFILLLALWYSPMKSLSAGDVKQKVAVEGQLFFLEKSIQRQQQNMTLSRPHSLSGKKRLTAADKVCQ